MQYKQLTIKERELIQEKLWQTQSIRTIAKELRRSPSSISRELKKNYPPNRRAYTSRLTQEKTLTYRSHRGREQKLKNHRVREYVIKHLKLGWSPEQIANTIRNKIRESISHEAIYQYIHAQIHRGGRGYIKPNCENLRPLSG